MASNPGITEELFGNYNFLLEIAGGSYVTENKVVVGGFKSVSGMDSETEIVEFKQGNDMIVRKKPGRTTYANIVLERGYTATDDLWAWRKNIEEGKIDRRSGSIIILDQDGLHDLRHDKCVFLDDLYETGRAYEAENHGVFEEEIKKEGTKQKERRRSIPIGTSWCKEKNVKTKEKKDEKI